GSDGGAHCCLASVRSQGNRAPKDSGENLRFGGEILGRAIGEQRSYGNSDKCVQRVPEEIEERNFVSYKFQSKKQTRGDDHGPRVEAVQRGWKVKNVQSCEYSERSHRGVDVQPRGKAGS